MRVSSSQSNRSRPNINDTLEPIKSENHDTENTITHSKLIVPDVFKSIVEFNLGILQLSDIFSALNNLEFKDSL